MFSKSLLLFTIFTAASSVLAQPHSRRDIHIRHARAVAARSSPSLSSPVDADANAFLRKSKRASHKRCRKPTPSEPAESTKVSVKSTQAPVNVAPEPTKASEEDDEPSPPSSTHKAQETETHAPSKPSPKPTSSKQDQDDDEPTSTHKEPKPTPTEKEEEPEPKPTKKPSGGNLPSFLTGTNHGQGTFYDTGLTACGVTNSNSDMIAAVSKDLFDAFPGATGNPNKNPVCGKKVVASLGGKSVTVTITDRCVGCKIGDLDFSPAAFNKLSTPSVGRFNGLEWHFV